MNTETATTETYFFDYKDKAIQDFVQPFKDESMTDKEKAIALYYKVRDGFRYNPYKIAFRKEEYRASGLVKKSEGHCLDKSIIYITSLRALGIPARLRLAKVENHIGVERLVEKFGSSVMTPHGFAEVYLNEKWIKCTPVFNEKLCEYCDVDPMEFDGENDSVFQEFNRSGGAFMKYLEDYGAFDDVPLPFIFQNMKENYPKLAAKVEGAEYLLL